MIGLLPNAEAPRGGAFEIGLLPKDVGAGVGFPKSEPGFVVELFSLGFGDSST